MISLPLILHVIFTKNKALISQFVNGKIIALMVMAFVGIILAFNIYLMIDAFSNSWL
jgi:Mn2+/Fe2+ NRAMP family transporter